MKKQLALAVIATAGICGFAQVQAQDGPPADPWGDATVSRVDEQTKAGERFAAIDKNADGSLSAEELAAAPQGPGGGRRGGPGGPGGGMRRADADGDGKVGKEEYLSSQLRRFDMQDGNKDGQLTKAERDAARAGMMSRMREGGGPGGFGGGDEGRGGFGGGDNGGGGNWGGGSGDQ
jgi:hypothetical protein